MTSSELKRAIQAAIRAAVAWGELPIEERRIEHIMHPADPVPHPWCEYCWPEGKDA